MTDQITNKKEVPNEIGNVIYDPIQFPQLLRFDITKKLTPDDLDITYFYCQLYRNSDERLELDEEKFNKTITQILSCNEQLLIIRTIILIIMMKNIFDTTNIFKRLIKEDILNSNNNSCDNSKHLIFNDIFFNELKKIPILILNFVEIIG